ncbi:MAG: hypothetical protein R3D26_19400 [Cyanobacteriota/Melainabacteria group bacterium]
MDNKQADTGSNAAQATEDENQANAGRCVAVVLPQPINSTLSLWTISPRASVEIVAISDIHNRRARIFLKGICWWSPAT